MEKNRALVRPGLRSAFFALGWLSFAAGAVGAFLPVLPTTPFLILSAFLFGKSSPRIHRWLLNLPTFGPMIVDWEKNRVIRPKAKLWALIVLTLAIGASVVFAELHQGLKIMLGLVWLGAGAFILTRKSS